MFLGCALVLAPLASNPDTAGHRVELVGRVCDHVAHNHPAEPGPHVVDVDRQPVTFPIVRFAVDTQRNASSTPPMT